MKDLRDYFVKSFYKDHVQRYKKRPIYWMFSSPKGSFNALVYLHRYNPSTVSTVLNEYLREFIKKLEVSLEQQERMIVSGANAREVAVAQKEAERLRKVLIELGTMSEISTTSRAIRSTSISTTACWTTTRSSVPL